MKRHPWPITSGPKAIHWNGPNKYSNGRKLANDNVNSVKKKTRGFVNTIAGRAIVDFEKTQKQATATRLKTSSIDMNQAGPLNQDQPIQ